DARKTKSYLEAVALEEKWMAMELAYKRHFANSHVTELEDTARHGDYFERRKAIRLLQWVHTEDTARFLLDLLLSETDQGIREQSAVSLGRIILPATTSEPYVVKDQFRDFVHNEVLQAYFAESDPLIRRQLYHFVAYLIAADLEDLYLENLRSRDFDLFKCSLDALSRLHSERALEPFFQVLNDLIRDYYFPTREWLGDKTANQRSTIRYIVLAFRDIGEAAVPFLLSHLDDPNPEVRRQVAMALGLLDRSEAVPELMVALQKSTNIGDKLLAIQLLKVLQAREAIPVLIQGLRDPYQDNRGFYRIRHAAFRALNKLGVECVNMGDGEYVLAEPVHTSGQPPVTNQPGGRNPCTSDRWS
ncbi:HEAT repeat domain-containing protein, partial [bacterium]|nr:HEAT repeat domain-containing protein [candidate division CSSED10-310 bacterium]